MDEFRGRIHGIVAVATGETVRFGHPECGGRIQLTRRIHPRELVVIARR
jgi:hypothetical protein